MFSISKVAAIIALALSSSLADSVPAPGDRVGSATLYHPSGLSTCGTNPKDTDRVAAVSKEIFALFGNTTAGNPICGRSITFFLPSGPFRFGSATVQELCENCDTNDILLSSAAFSILADPAVGVVDTVNWGFLLGEPI